jgi:hypothetical protein
VPFRGPLARLLWWTGVLSGGALAVVGGLGLRGAGLVAVGVAAVLAACIAVGIAREVPGRDGRAAVESAVQAAAWTVASLLALAGLATLAGGFVALLAGGAAGTAWLAVRVARSSRRSEVRGARPPAAPSWPLPGVEVLRPTVPPPEEGTSSPSSVSGLPTSALGREWLRTSAALRGRLSPADRAALVRRREETLDELERRDPAGFARWLAEGPEPGSDPAAYVHGRPVQGDPAAGTDAA